MPDDIERIDDAFDLTVFDNRHMPDMVGVHQPVNLRQRFRNLTGQDFGCHHLGDRRGEGCGASLVERAQDIPARNDTEDRAVFICHDNGGNLVQLQLVHSAMIGRSFLISFPFIVALRHPRFDQLQQQCVLIHRSIIG